MVGGDISDHHDLLTLNQPVMRSEPFERGYDGVLGVGG